MADKKPLTIERFRLKIGKALYEDTFKENGGPGWLTIPKDVQEGFVRMVGVMFNVMFEEDEVTLAEFFVDEKMNKEEFDFVILKARQTCMTLRRMQQTNAFVQRDALFSMAEAMLEDLYNIVEDTPAATEPVLAQFGEYRAALDQIKEACDPANVRKEAVERVRGGRGAEHWEPGGAQVAPSSILGADGKPMVAQPHTVHKILCEECKRLTTEPFGERCAHCNTPWPEEDTSFEGLDPAYLAEQGLEQT